MTDSINFFKYFNGKTFDIHVLRDFRIIRPGEFQELLQDMARLFEVEKASIGFMNLSDDAFKVLCKHVQLMKNPVIRTSVRQLKLFDPQTDFALLNTMVFPMRLKQMQVNPLQLKVIDPPADLFERLSHTTNVQDHIDICTSIITDSIQKIRASHDYKTAPLNENAARFYYRMRLSFQSLMEKVPEFYFFKDYADLLCLTRMMKPQKAVVVDKLVKAYDHSFQTLASPLTLREMRPKVLLLTKLTERAIFYNPSLPEKTRATLFNRYPEILRHTEEVLYWNSLSSEEMIRHIYDNYEKE